MVLQLEFYVAHLIWISSKFLLKLYEEDVISPNYNLAVVCQNVSPVELLSIYQNQIHVGINVAHLAAIFDLALQSHGNLSIDRTLQGR